MKVEQIKFEIPTTTCICGGWIGANEQGVIAHSLPTCRDYDNCESIADAADLLERCRIKNGHE